MIGRRALLGSGAALALPSRAAPGQALEQALRGSLGAGSVLMLRHALAPGNFDPPGFSIDDCSTQRNLDDEGRRQARQLQAWFAARSLRPTRVRSSPWCRCLETARLAFGDRVEPWPALGSPHAVDAAARALALAQLRAGLAGAAKRGAGFDVWVTHGFVFSALLGEGAGPAEGVLLGLGEAQAPRLLARATGLAG